MPSFLDQLGRTLSLPQTPHRIISLVPSQTELLSTLGLDDAVVGITSHMLQYAGFTNIFAGQDRYPAIDLTSLSGYQNLHILLSSEPYPFRQRHVDEIKEVLPQATVRLVDGEFFSWYGSRLLDAPAYFRSIVQ